MQEKYVISLIACIVQPGFPNPTFQLKVMRLSDKKTVDLQPPEHFRGKWVTACTVFFYLVCCYLSNSLCSHFLCRPCTLSSCVVHWILSAYLVHCTLLFLFDPFSLPVWPTVLSLPIWPIALSLSVLFTVLSLFLYRPCTLSSCIDHVLSLPV